LNLVEGVLNQEADCGPHAGLPSADFADAAAWSQFTNLPNSYDPAVSSLSIIIEATPGRFSAA
jgi:hypothetical protein